jgi:MFS superfamily sulfate permease-like transporter
MGLVHGLLFKNLLSDIYGSRVASVVVLPLSLAFAVASELGAIAGWYWAIFVGFIATLAGGTSAQVSGSTGTMIVVLLTTILVDTIIAMAVGIVSTSLFFMKRMADFELANLHIITHPSANTPLLPEEATILEQANGKILLIHVDGPMSFGLAKDMVRRLESVLGFNTFSSVVLDLFVKGASHRCHRCLGC